MVLGRDGGFFKDKERDIRCERQRIDGLIDADHEPWSGAQFEPRDWQAEARVPALESINSGNRGLISAIMGAGKSFLISEVCASLRRHPNAPVVVTTPRVRLVKQLRESIGDRLEDGWSINSVGAYYGGEKSTDTPVIVCCMSSAQKLAGEIRDKDVPVWIADEAHRTECETFHRAFEAIDPYSVLGFTATPFRAEEEERLSLFDSLLYEYGPADAMGDGVVVPPKLRHYTGDATDVDVACLSMIREVVESGGGPGLVNALTKKDAEEYADYLTESGIDAGFIHSGQHSDDNEWMMRRLETGKLDCVVHVNMLSEGVDFPWLRWLCMRRPVSSRVRFCQEVGRVLRSHEGKEYALLLDPHDLFSEFGLSYEAVLEGGRGVELDDEDAKAQDLDSTLDDLEMGLYDNPETNDAGIPVVAIEPTIGWLRRMRLKLLSMGWIENKITSSHWRTDPPSRSQLRTLKWLHKFGAQKAPEGMPKEHSRAVRSATKMAFANSLTKGDVSDLMSILFACKEMDSWMQDPKEEENNGD